MEKEITIEEYKKLSGVEQMAYRYNNETGKYNLVNDKELNELFWCMAESMDMGHKL